MNNRPEICGRRVTIWIVSEKNRGSFLKFPKCGVKRCRFFANLRDDSDLDSKFSAKKRNLSEIRSPTIKIGSKLREKNKKMRGGFRYFPKKYPKKYNVGRTENRNRTGGESESDGKSEFVLQNAGMPECNCRNVGMPECNCQMKFPNLIQNLIPNSIQKPIYIVFAFCAH